MLNFKKLPILISLMLAVSCGDLFTKHKKDSKVNFSELATCSMNNLKESFSHILDTKIKGDILCLQQNLHVFLKVVRTDKPGYLNKSKLKTYLKKNVDDLGDVDKILDGIFSLSYLMFGGDGENIHQKNIDELVDFLIYFNEHVYQIYFYFNKDTNGHVSFERHESQRQVVYNEASLIAQQLDKIFVKNRTGVDTIDMEKFTDDFFDSLENRTTFEKIKSLLFVKRIFFGGSRKELTHKELHNAILKLPSLVQIVFDIARIDKIRKEGRQHDLMRLLRRDIKNVQADLFFGRHELEEVMTVKEVINAVEKLFPDLLGDDIKLSKYISEIMELKKPFMGESGPFITASEIFNLLDHGEFILKKGEVFYKIYDFYRKDLDSVKPVTQDFRDYPVYSRDEEEMLYDFARIANEYRFFKGNLDSPIFSHEYKRNPDGFFEIMVVEYVVTILFKEYGEANPLARGGYHMQYSAKLGIDHVTPLLSKLKYILKDIGLITIGRVNGGEVNSTADNLVLMSTLFQYQSDGCNKDVCMEVPEITEFLVGLLTSLSVKDDFVREMKSLCGAVDSYDRIGVQCFRENFMKVLSTPLASGRSLKDYMPLLYGYLEDLVKEGGGVIPTDSKPYLKFISETEEFTRTCTFYDSARKEEIPMKANDAFAVFAGLLNVESTLLRFDTNKDNRLNGDKKNNEVLKAYYEVYEGAIKALVAPNGGFMEKMAKPIFEYLVKYGKVPDTNKFKTVWDFIKFLLKVNKRSDATRTTIATILKTLGEQGDTQKFHPFKCDECMRNPNLGCEPEDTFTWSEWCERYPERASCQ